MKIADIKVEKLFQKTLFGVLCLFGVIGLSTSILLIYTVNDYLSEEYEDNSKDIAKTIADSSVDILLNRDLAALQSLIDQFVEIQGISYIYIADETGEFLAHTFVPGIPEEILVDDPTSTETVEREIDGMGDFVEVGSPILAGGCRHRPSRHGHRGHRTEGPARHRQAVVPSLHHIRGGRGRGAVVRQAGGKSPARRSRLRGGARPQRRK